MRGDERVDSSSLAAFQIPDSVLTALAGGRPEVIEVRGEITDRQVEKWKSQVLGLGRNDALLMIIDSTGGSAAILPLCELIHSLRIPRAALVIGQAFSNAFMLLGAFPQDCRFGTRSSTYLTHSIRTHTEIGGRVDPERQLIGGLSLDDWIAVVTNWYQNGFRQEQAAEALRQSYFPNLAIDNTHLRLDIQWSADDALRWEIIGQIIGEDQKQGEP